MHEDSLFPMYQSRKPGPSLAAGKLITQ